MFSFWTCLQELRVCFALFRSCFGLCVSPAAVLDHEVAQLAAQVHRYALPEPAAMDGDDDLHSEATTRVDWTTGERLREASTAESAVPEASRYQRSLPDLQLFRIQLSLCRLQLMRHLQLLRIQVLNMKLQQNLLPQ